MVAVRIGLLAVTSAIGIGMSWPAFSANPDCYTSRDRVCPVAGNFDRCFGDPNIVAPKPTPVGTLACDALNDGAAVIERLDKGLDAVVRQSTRDMQAAVAVIAKDAINADAAASFASARQSLVDTVANVRAFVDDRRCGVKGSLRGAQAGLQKLVAHLQAAGEIAPRAAAAAGQGLRATAEVASGLTEVSGLAADLGEGSERARAELQKVNSALASAQKSLEALDRAGTGKAFDSGVRLTSTVGPFVANCHLCIGLLTTAIGNAGASVGSGAVGGGTCPKTGGGGCVVGVPVAAITGASSAFAGAISSAPCAAASSDAERLGEYVDNIQNFVEASLAVATNLEKTASALNQAAAALKNVAEEAPKATEARVSRARVALGRAATAVNDGIATLEKEVAPRVSKLGAGLIQQMSDTAEDMTFCWHEATALAVETGEDTVKAVTLLGTASANLVDGGKVFQNIERQAATSRFKAVDRQYQELHRDLWGVPWGKTDVVKTASHLAGLVGNETKLKKINKDVGKLADGAAAMISASVQAGNAAFLDRDRLKTQSRERFDAAEQAARKAKIELAKARGKAKRARPKPRREVKNMNFEVGKITTRATLDTSGPRMKP
jgi:uncharacterized phage infection (PIP) family protein YhgE